MKPSRTTNGRATVQGRVVEALPSALYRVDIGGHHRIVAHVDGGSDRNFVRILVGDQVVVELMPRDLTRGRIVRKVSSS
jgi:translation initiation factor IF-1